MQYQTSLLYLLAALPSALCITTIQAYLAPTNAGASVITVASQATTYTILCTSLCAAAGDNNQATLVNGPSTAGFTNTQEGGQKTLIIDCKLNGKSDKAECVKKAISTGQTVSATTTLLLTKADVVITAGMEKLGYAVVTKTAEVNVTQTAATITSGTETVTSGVPKTTKRPTVSSSSSVISDTSVEASVSTSATSAVAAGVKTSTARGMSEPVATSSSRAAAPTMGPEGLGAALAGIAGLMLAAL